MHDIGCILHTPKKTALEQILNPIFRFYIFIVWP